MHSSKLVSLKTEDLSHKSIGIDDSFINIIAESIVRHKRYITKGYKSIPEMKHADDATFENVLIKRVRKIKGTTAKIIDARKLVFFEANNPMLGIKGLKTLMRAFNTRITKALFQHLFKLALDHKITDREAYHIYLYQCLSAKDDDRAIALLHDIPETMATDVFNSFIISCIKLNAIDPPLRAITLSNCQATQDIYLKLMKYYANQQEITLATHLIKHLIKKNITLPILFFNVYINLARKMGEPKHACKAAKYADHELIANEFTYSLYIDSLVLSNKLDKAISMFDKTYPDFDAKQKLFDFHGYNFGESYIACYKIFSLNKEAKLIIGKGSHTVSPSVVRHAVASFCKLHEIKMEVDPRNEGVVNCTYSHSLTLQTIHFSFERTIGYILSNEANIAIDTYDTATLFMSASIEPTKVSAGCGVVSSDAEPFS